MKRRICLAALQAAMFLVFRVGAATAEQIAVYGATLPGWQGGAFRPAGTELSCTELDRNGRCWDGHKWHILYPPGQRHYARANGQVDCMVIVKQSADCWDGRHRYKLPIGTIFGAVLPGFQGGAFRTMPLPPDAKR